ncbi:hypothetical protein HELRODRAFT_162042 [Helobdella robusta]|uniref:Uncharacterized protein n=1 Tax=Helobdella robusta TaxID=6412 RepID=T1ES67_HELRO|nr:hypothetical protein HELRODRAFT_162042 [Helobdella robusta]ESN98611.1 hypothetical protein HELRODRAFT_162042 [Helobdella robusta]
MYNDEMRGDGSNDRGDDIRKANHNDKSLQGLQQQLNYNKTSNNTSNMNDVIFITIVIVFCNNNENDNGDDTKNANDDNSSGNINNNIGKKENNDNTQDPYITPVNNSRHIQIKKSDFLAALVSRAL